MQKRAGKVDGYASIERNQESPQRVAKYELE